MTCRRPVGTPPNLIVSSLALIALVWASPSPTVAGEREAPVVDAPATHATRNEIIPIAAWQAPPRIARPIARWWWPGGSVEEAALQEQLDAIAAAGFGAVELQPLLLGIGEDELEADAALRSVGRPAFRTRVARAAQR